MKSPETLIKRYTEAATTLNREALISVYAPDVRIFDLMAPWQNHGTDEWAARVDHWFNGVGSDPEVVASEIEIVTTTGMAVLTMNMGYYHVNDEGNREGMTNRLTWVAIPVDDDWKIVHEHTSIPIREADMSPQFEP